MNKILLNYIIFNYLKVILKVTFLFYLFGMILNLFEEIEFFKNQDQHLKLSYSVRSTERI